MQQGVWFGPWKCKVCGKLFKCQDRAGNCSRSKPSESGCYCVDHSRMTREDKLHRCNVVPHDYIPKPRKGKMILTELIQLG